MRVVRIHGFRKASLYVGLLFWLGATLTMLAKSASRLHHTVLCTPFMPTRGPLTKQAIFHYEISVADCVVIAPNSKRSL